MSKSKKVLVIGFGSIGKRHASVFNELGADVAVLSKRIIEWPQVFSILDEALSIFEPDYILICNKTVEHESTLAKINESNFSGVVLVEKPLFSKISIKLDVDQSNIYVGYNLRFHPVLKRLKEELRDKKIISANVYCGQYLPTWRPESDYRESYSSDKNEGGGVLRDLSHEIDYCLWLFGPAKKVIALGGQHSSLEISSNDSVSILAETQKCKMLNITLNYLDRKIQRQIIIVCDEVTYTADLIESKLLKNNETVMNLGPYKATYHDQATAILNNGKNELCSYIEGVETINFIDLVERSMSDEGWINI